MKKNGRIKVNIVIDKIKKIVVMSVDVQKFVSLLIQMGITAYYVIKNNSAVIFEKKLDDQDTEYGKYLTQNISKIFNSITVYTTVHDSDVLLMYIYKDGILVFYYDSQPGSIEGIDTLLHEFPHVKKVKPLGVR